MKRILMAAVVVLVLGTMGMAQVLANPTPGPKPQGPNAKASKPQPPDTKPAQIAAGSWVRLIDDGQYGDSWDIASSLLKERVEREKWEKNIKAVREPFGKMLSRKLGSTDYRTSMPGLPEGKYVMMRLDSSFANKKDATEIVVVMLDKDGQWRVSEYLIK